jgi:hypothetical protein
MGMRLRIGNHSSLELVSLLDVLGAGSVQKQRCETGTSSSSSSWQFA